MFGGEIQNLGGEISPPKGPEKNTEYIEQVEQFHAAISVTPGVFELESCIVATIRFLWAAHDPPPAAFST